MSQEIAIIATNARPIGPNMTYVREETITVAEPLTDAERWNTDRKWPML